MQSINLSDKKLKLLHFVIKRYEKDIDLYIFYNAKNKLFWETDFTTGSVVCALDGSLETEEIFKILSENSDTPLEEISDYFSEIFVSLIQKEFINVQN